MRRVIPLICVGLLLTTAASAFAQQQRLFALMSREVVELDPRSGPLGAVLRRFPLPAGVSGSGAVSFGGGEFLAWTSQGAAILLNTRTGAVQQFRFSEFDGASFSEPLGIVGTDGNARLLLGGSNGSGRRILLVADARSGSRQFRDLGRTLDLQPMAYAAASDVLFVARPVELVFGPQQPRRLIDVIHASSGTLLKTLDVSPHIPFGLSTNAAGTRVFVTYGSGTFAFDTISGALVASNTSSPLLKGLLGLQPALDDHRNRLVVSLEPRIMDYEAFAGVSAFSADSLQFIGKATVPELPLPPSSRETETFSRLTQEIDVSGLSATIFALQAVEVSHGKYYTVRTCHESQLIALDAHTGALRQTVSTTAALGAGACKADLVRITEPAPPQAPTAEVSGHQVRLRWQAPLDATGYQVEAGSAPGLANLATITVTDSQLVVDAVPSGVYHVRVRATNTIGKSSASQEIQVVVR